MNGPHLLAPRKTTTTAAAPERSVPVPAALPRPSHLRGAQRRATRHQERLVADWLRSLASGRA